MMMKVARMMIKLAVLTAVTVTVIDSVFRSVSISIAFLHILCICEAGMTNEVYSFFFLFSVSLFFQQEVLCERVF